MDNPSDMRGDSNPYKTPQVISAKILTTGKIIVAILALIGVILGFLVTNEGIQDIITRGAYNRGFEDGFRAGQEYAREQLTTPPPPNGDTEENNGENELPTSRYMVDIVRAFTASQWHFAEYSALNSPSDYPPSGFWGIETSDMTSFRMSGVTYQNGFRFGGRNVNGWARFNLGGEFTQITGLLGVLDGFNIHSNHSGVLEVYHESVLHEVIPIYSNMLPRPITLDVSGVTILELRIEISANNPVDFAIANPIIE